MVIAPPDRGWVVQVDDDIENACGENGMWRAPDISTDHFVLDSDSAAFAYGRHFVGRVSIIRRVCILCTCVVCTIGSG